MNDHYQLNTIWWSGLHFLLALSLPVLLIVLVGCKQAKAKREDLGSPVSSEAINDALGKAMENSSLNTFAVSQFVRYSHTRRIENNETVIDLGEKYVGVIDRQDTPSEAHFTLSISEKERTQEGGYRTLTSEEALWLRKMGTSSTASLAQKPGGQALTAESLRAQSFVGQAGTTTFHHLKIQDAQVPPPDAIKARSDCGGLSPCQLNVRYVQFEMALWSEGSNYQKINFDFMFSMETPFIPYGDYFNQLNGALITDCRSTFVPVDSRTVFVRDCFNLEDFKK